jgi:hypothetical protein
MDILNGLLIWGLKVFMPVNNTPNERLTVGLESQENA